MSHAVFIVEDEPNTLSLLERTVGDHEALTVSGAVGNYTDAMARVKEIVASDVLLVDLGLPDGDGSDIIRYVSHAEDAPNILVISVFGDERHVVRAIEAGADGYLLKDSSTEELGDAILGVMNGESPINPAIARHLLKKFRTTEQPPEPADKPHITPRELEVLKLIVRGFSNAELAKLLEVSHYTVTSHIKNLYKKLAVGSRSEAIFEAVQLGLVDIKRPADG